ncbi:hypothetical protein [Phytoactinopolyspora endophytica]|uniref:hypothetical protein n=1 Tax=Phytoactinopolyspora endophytica TaxID=1642495 RepID=UPI00101C31A8|nr:hypothetical protein [Phytoactinopolyspora endophytica]
MHHVDGRACRIRRLWTGGSPSQLDGAARRVLPTVMVVIGLTVAACGSDNGDAADDAVAERSDGDDGGESVDGQDPANGETEDPGQADGDESGGEDTGDEHADGEPENAEAGGEGDRTAPQDEPVDDGTDDGEDESPDSPAASNVPDECPEEVREVGDRITGDFEYVEVPPTEDVAILTCDWRDSGKSIASIEVSFSQELIGTDLADVEGAEDTSVGDVDGYVMRAAHDKAQANMFQFHVAGVYVTGGSIEVEDVDQGDVLELAEAAVDALAEASG